MKDSWDVLIENIVSMMDEYGDPVETEADLPDLSELVTGLSLTIETLAVTGIVDIKIIGHIVTTYIRTAYTMGLKRGQLGILCPYCRKNPCQCDATEDE